MERRRRLGRIAVATTDHAGARRGMALHLRQQIAVIGFTGKAIRHHVAVAFEELHELRHGVDEAQRHVRLKACWLMQVNVHRIIPPEERAS